MDHYNNKIKAISLYFRKLRLELTKVKHELLEKKNKDVLLMGPHETCLRRNLDSQFNLFIDPERRLASKTKNKDIGYC